MKVLFDTNVILDLLLEREKYIDAAEQVISMVEQGVIEGYICATTVTTINYLINKAYSRAKSKDITKQLIRLFEISPVNRLVMEEALDCQFTDFEDAVLHASAVSSGMQIIITRNKKDFKAATIAVYTPLEMLNLHVESFA